MAEQTGEKTTSYRQAVGSIRTRHQLGQVVESARQPESGLPPVIVAIAQFSYHKARESEKDFSRRETSPEAREAKTNFIKTAVRQALHHITTGKSELIPVYLQELAKYYSILVSAHSALRLSPYSDLEEKGQNALLAQLNKEVFQGGIENLTVREKEIVYPASLRYYEQFKTDVFDETDKTIQGVISELLVACYLRHAGYQVLLGQTKEDINHGIDLKFSSAQKGIKIPIWCQIKSHYTLPSGELFDIAYHSNDPVSIHIALAIPAGFLSKERLRELTPIFSPAETDPPDPRIEKFRTMLESALNEKRQYEQRKSSRQSK